MSKIPQDLQYTEEHEWVNRTGEEGVVEIGITDYAQGELGDVVFVELPAEHLPIGVDSSSLRARRRLRRSSVGDWPEPHGSSAARPSRNPRKRR